MLQLLGDMMCNRAAPIPDSSCPAQAVLVALGNRLLQNRVEMVIINQQLCLSKKERNYRDIRNVYDEHAGGINCRCLQNSTILTGDMRHRFQRKEMNSTAERMTCTPCLHAS
jgi:hypothetical protein